MPDRAGPQVYSIAAHRGFADALVAGLLPRYSDGDLGLARLTLLLPSRRAARTVTEAFVRVSQGGMLLPRMAVVGDLDLDETLGPLLDPIGEGAEIPPAADPTRRWLRLAQILHELGGQDVRSGAALLREAFEVGRTMDRLLVEGISPADLLAERIVGIVGEQAEHWAEGTRLFLMAQAYWQAELEARGEVDGPTRRNLLFDHACARWRANPPANPIVAAGITSASPALADLLRVVSELPRGAVILPDLDLAMDDEVWEELGVAGAPSEKDAAPFARNDAVTHPQYHLKLLLNRMGIGRQEVQPWHRSGLGASQPERSRAISNLFLPEKASARWINLSADQRRLNGVRLMESAHPEEEAQAIAILIRQAVEVPDRRVALITPDRGLAARVIAQLRRWNIEADDTAGQPLSQTPAGRLFLHLADVIGENCAPAALLALLTHPLVRAGEERPAWLEAARQLDLRLRGPRPAAGLQATGERAGTRLRAWWQDVEAVLGPLLEHGEDARLTDILDTMLSVGESLCGEGLWQGADGRCLSAFVEELRETSRETDFRINPIEVATVLRDAMERSAVRPPWGGHPRVSVYGLIEARMSRADLVICGGLVEGKWPAKSAPDSLLPPAVLRALGIPGADFRIGLSAHDLAAALGAPEVVLSWAHRDEGGPVIPSRFVLRIKAMLGDLSRRHQDQTPVELARQIDLAPAAGIYPRPQPMPDARQRTVDISVTGLDRLRGDPYQFYANSILGLKSLDPLDAEPSHAWKGTAVHAILQRWHESGGKPEELVPTAEQVLDELSAHPLMRSLWRPRLVKALEWIAKQIESERSAGRSVIGIEAEGSMMVQGIRVHGRADRIDRLPDGTLAVVDYKTGYPPSGRMVQEGYALQLGLIGLMAEAGGFRDISGEATRFEYWSLSRQKKGDGFGFVEEPILDGKKKSGVPREDFLPEARRFLVEAIDRWILGNDPFTARLNPDIGGYNDYDQLMRLDEWIPHLQDENRSASPAEVSP